MKPDVPLFRFYDFSVRKVGIKKLETNQSLISAVGHLVNFSNAMYNPVMPWTVIDY
jgi:hypothetical protein